jgi:hypothetical protein
MADPLGLAASIVTLITVVNFTIQTVRNVTNAPEELKRLNSELEHIKIVANELKGLKDDTAGKYLTAHIDMTCSNVSQLQSILDQCNKGTHDVKFCSWRWAMHRKKIERLGTQLRKMKAILLADANIIAL